MGLFDGATHLGRGRREEFNGYNAVHYIDYDIYVMNGRIIAAHERWEYGFFGKKKKRLTSPDYHTFLCTENEAIEMLLAGNVPLASFIDKLPTHAEIPHHRAA